MKKIVSLGLAALMAAATMTAMSGEASAKPKYWKNQYFPHGNNMYHPYGNTFYPQGNFFAFSGAPFFFGFSIGPQYQPRRHFYRVANPHVRWCLNHYRTYNPATNLFFIKKGVPAVCVSPFSY